MVSGGLAADESCVAEPAFGGVTPDSIGVAFPGGQARAC